MEKRFYKIGLSVNFGKELNLIEELEKLVEAAREFTKESNYKKIINLFSIDKDIIYFLIVFNANKDLDKFMMRSIGGLLKKLCAIYNVEYSSKRKYFSIQEYIPISKEEYPNMLARGIINIGESFKKGIKNEEANIIPIRKFPLLVAGMARISANDKKDDIEFLTLEDSLMQLDNLIGLDQVKEKIREINSFIIRNNERYISLNIDNPGLYYNVAISGNSGTGKNTIAKIIYHIYYHLGVIGKGKFIVINSKDIYPGNNLDRYIGNAQSGVVLIDDAHLISESGKTGTKDNSGTLEEWFSNYKANFVFILAGEKEGTKELIKNEKLRKHMNFLLDIPDFNEAETLELVKYFGAKEKYSIDTEDMETISRYFLCLKEKKRFENAYSARRIIEKAIINNGVLNNSNHLTKKDFSLEEISNFENKIDNDNEPDPFEELEGLIGLREVKEKVKEISAYAGAQLRRKELGLKTEHLCLHMNYVGNPGTGKTTVARYMGKILKEMGILSTGKFVEVAREDLVGKYVGHTAMKTAEKIKEAEGGILFLDEAYSLQSESKIDYGQEAVNTLVKKMEDLRGNLVIIFAGYPKEMSRFINMNPGLKDRIQFQLEFVDYKPQELLEIMKKFFTDSQYEIEEVALKEMEKIANKFYKNRDCNFSNGRIMRKCFERVKIHQAVRIMKDNLTEVEDIKKINIEDIESLYKDHDIAIMLEENIIKRRIGFAV
jgi:ATP-dependent 26S proteasome regulatory subunit